MRARDALVWPNVGAAHPRDGEARALRLFCENGPALPTNRPKTHDDILIVSYFADKLLEQPVFTTKKTLGHRRVHRRGDAGTGRLRRPDQPLPAPKCEPMLT